MGQSSGRHYKVRMTIFSLECSISMMSQWSVSHSDAGRGRSVSLVTLSLTETVGVCGCNVGLIKMGKITRAEKQQAKKEEQVRKLLQGFYLDFLVGCQYNADEMC